MLIRPTSSPSRTVFAPTPAEKPAVHLAAAVDVFETGDRNATIKALQADLIRLGYLRAHDFKGGHGYFGPTTAKALRQFQHDHGLPQSGVLDDRTQRRVSHMIARVRELAGTTLEKGQTNEAVRVWQRKLVRAGYLTQAEMDSGPGTFGERTRAATLAFQRENGLVVSGKVGEATNGVMTKYLEAGKHRPPPPPSVVVRNISQLYSDGTDDDWNSENNCGPTTVAMIAKAFGFHRDDWRDGTLVNWLGVRGSVFEDGAGWPQVQTMARAAGLTASAPMQGHDLEWVKAQLRAGKLIAANGNRSVTLDNSTSGGTATGGHWIVIKGLDANGNFLVEDPSTNCKVLSPGELARYFDARDGGGYAIAIGR